MIIMISRSFLLLIVNFIGWTPSADGLTTSSTQPIGLVRKDCPANSDTRLSIPLEREAEYAGILIGVAANVLTFQGTPGWTANQFEFAAGIQDERYFIVFLTGTHVGRSYDVIANGVNSITIDRGVDDLTGIEAGDGVKLLPHWTLDSAFPNGRGVTASSIFRQETGLLVQDGTTAGINLAPVRTYFFTNSWKDFNFVNDDAGPTVIRPHQPLLVRNRDSGTSAIFVGVVPVVFGMVAAG